MNTRIIDNLLQLYNSLLLEVSLLYLVRVLRVERKVSLGVRGTKS